MNVYDYIIIGSVALWLVFTAIITVKRKKNGRTCNGCNGCNGCAGCKSACEKKRGNAEK